MSKKASVLPAASVEPDPAQRPQPEQRAERRQRRAGGDQPHHLRRRLLALVPARERVGDQPRQLGAEDQPAVGGVVVGDEDERLLGLRVARRRRDVPGRAVAQDAAEDVRAARDVVDDPRRGEQAERGGAPPAERGEHARGRQQPERQRHRADRALLLDPRGRRPAASSSPRIHSAARRSPSEAEGRSKDARCSTVARRRSTSGGMAAAGYSSTLRRSMAADPDCLFCKIVAGEVPSTRVHEDERTIAFMDINPATRGHLLVIPREHATDLRDIDARGPAAPSWPPARRSRARWRTSSAPTG